MYRTVDHFHFYVSYIENFTVCIFFFHLLYIFIYIYIFPRFREVDIHSCEGRNAFQKIFKCTLNNYIHPSFKKQGMEQTRNDPGCRDAGASVDASFGFALSN